MGSAQGYTFAAEVVNDEIGEVVSIRDLTAVDNGALSVWSAAPWIDYVVDVRGWFGPPVAATLRT